MNGKKTKINIFNMILLKIPRRYLIFLNQQSVLEAMIIVKMLKVD